MYRNKLLAEFSEFLVLAVALAMVLFVADVPSIGADNGSSILEEVIEIDVSCDDATVLVRLTLLSRDGTLIHFPSTVDMSDPHLENCLSITVGATLYQTSLRYLFENVTSEDARAHADSVTPSISTAFGVSFSWSYTQGESPAPIDVNYAANAYPNITSFAEWLVSTGIIPDVKGFSEAIPSLIAKKRESGYPMSIWLMADKSYASGGNWGGYIETPPSLVDYIPTGSDSHTIDVLDILGVPLLAPSPYSYDAGTYKWSIIERLTISSSNPTSFVSCEPSLAQTPGEKGWTYTTYDPYPGIVAQFSFGSNSTPVTGLSFTFGGTVIPEFTLPSLILILMLVASGIFILKKRLQKSPPPSII